MPRAKEGKKSVSLYLDEDTYKAVKKLAIDEGKSSMDLLAEIVTEWVNERQTAMERRRKK